MNVGIQLSSEQVETLTRLAVSSGKPWQAVLTEALASYERLPHEKNGEREESVHAAMQRLGLLGCVDDAPADLSTNPAYMEGFGSHGG